MTAAECNQNQVKSFSRRTGDDDVRKTPVIIKTLSKLGIYKEKIPLESQKFQSVAFERIIEFSEEDKRQNLSQMSLSTIPFITSS